MRCELPLILVSGIGIGAVHASGPHQVGTTLAGPEPAVWESDKICRSGTGHRETCTRSQQLVKSLSGPRLGVPCSMPLSANVNLEQRWLWRTEEPMITVLRPEQNNQPSKRNSELRRYPASWKPLRARRFRPKPSELSASVQGFGVPHSGIEAKCEMGHPGNNPSELGSEAQSDCSGDCYAAMRRSTASAQLNETSKESRTQATLGTLSGSSQPTEYRTIQNRSNATAASDTTRRPREKSCCAKLSRVPPLSQRARNEKKRENPVSVTTTTWRCGRGPVKALRGTVSLLFSHSFSPRICHTKPVLWFLPLLLAATVRKFTPACRELMFCLCCSTCTKRVFQDVPMQCYLLQVDQPPACTSGVTIPRRSAGSSFS